MPGFLFWESCLLSSSFWDLESSRSREGGERRGVAPSRARHRTSKSQNEEDNRDPPQKRKSPDIIGAFGCPPWTYFSLRVQ